MSETPKTYIGTKTVRANPMTRGAYNAYRGWKVPADENPADEGYLVEYTDGGKANHQSHQGYISWSPKDVFERAYYEAEAVDPNGCRLVVGHTVEGDNQPALAVFTTDKPGAGGAYHRYLIGGFDAKANPSSTGWDKQAPGLMVLFQNGPLQENKRNGVTVESLIQVCIDRLECFQAGPFPSRDNAEALKDLKDALNHLHDRTRDRIKRQVEGLNKA